MDDEEFPNIRLWVALAALCCIVAVLVLLIDRKTKADLIRESVALRKSLADGARAREQLWADAGDWAAERARQEEETSGRGEGSSDHAGGRGEPRADLEPVVPVADDPGAPEAAIPDAPDYGSPDDDGGFRPPHRGGLDAGRAGYGPA